MNNEFVLYGSKVMIAHLNHSNVNCYLSTYKSASAFSKVYDTMPDFWEHTCRRIEDYADGKQGSKARYLIVEKASSQGVGYIELDYSNLEMPEVDIAILEEHRGKGYAFEAARILFLNIFENNSIKCIVWNAFRSNKASRRIAEKLGGNEVEEKNLVMEAMQAAGLKVNPANYEGAPAIVTYEICKRIFMDRFCNQEFIAADITVDNRAKDE